MRSDITLLSQLAHLSVWGRRVSIERSGVSPNLFFFLGGGQDFFWNQIDVDSLRFHAA